MIGNRVRLRRCVLVLALGCALAAAGAGSLHASHASGYHWARTANPFTLKLGDNVSAVWDPHLAVAAADWSASSVLDTVVVAGSGRPRTCAAKSGRVELCSATYGNTGWLALTQFWTTGGNHLTQATVKLNDTYLGSPPYNTPEFRQYLICQQIGRTLGLSPTNPNPGSCMTSTSDPATHQHPNQHDYDQLEAIYAHLDGFTTVGLAAPPGGPGSAGRGGMPPAMAEIDFAGPGQWGPAVWASTDGRVSLHVLDFGGGFEVVTLAVWALPEDFERERAERPIEE